MSKHKTHLQRAQVATQDVTARSLTSDNGVEKMTYIESRLLRARSNAAGPQDPRPNRLRTRRDDRDHAIRISIATN